MSSKCKGLEVIIEQGLVGFCGDYLFNSRELGIPPEYIRKCFNDISGDYKEAVSWSKICDTLRSNGIDPTFSVLTTSTCLFELKENSVDIKPILKSMDKKSGDLDHLFHDFSVIKVAHSYSEEGYKVEFISDKSNLRRKPDLMIDGLNVEIKRRMGFLKEKKFLTGKACKLLDQGVNRLEGGIENTFSHKKADVCIYDVTTSADLSVLPLLKESKISTSKPPKLQKGATILVWSYPNGEKNFSFFDKEE
jgi:hypothetical protein